MADKIRLEGNRLHCPFVKSHFDIFFSLVDYRNNYFTSNDTEKIIEFYNGFENRDQLIQWMKERPKGSYTIHEVEGDKDIIVVIPTADYNGKYAKECRENIFKGLHIIFVESGGKDDFYFNYAHNCNVGIKKAMEYNPKWVVVSNDDMIKIDETSILIRSLKEMDDESVNVVLTKNNIQNSIPTVVCHLNFFGQVAVKIFSITNVSKVYYKINSFVKSNKINARFGNKLIISGAEGNRFFRKFFKTDYTYVNFESFGIFSSKFIKDNETLFDETYINAHEDQDLAIQLSFEQTKIAYTDFKINGIGGISLGSNFVRELRTVASDSYFNNKWKDKFS
ncbi:MAG: hypothetical protein QXU18_07335 [Thermoplasmatales archaeon]